VAAARKVACSLTGKGRQSRRPPRCELHSTRPRSRADALRRLAVWPGRRARGSAGCACREGHRCGRHRCDTLAAPRSTPLMLHPSAAYLNIEPVHGPCAGESAGVEALQQCGVTRVVLGLLHPLPRLRGQAHAALLAAGLRVDVLSQADASAEHGLADTLQAMQRVNEALLHRVATGLPFSVWKYAMTLDGKIATRTGHSAWVSGARTPLRPAPS